MNKQRIVLINPPIVSDKALLNEGGIPYMPIILASINSILKDKYEVKIYDMFGMYPKLIKDVGDKFIYGLDIDAAHYFGGEKDIAIVYANYAIAFEQIKDLIRVLKEEKFKRIIVVENSQHVAAFPLDLFSHELYVAGADIILCGDPEVHIIDAIEGRIHNETCIRAFSEGGYLPIPDWGGFPLENYWNLPYAHAPREHKEYIPLLTSRGCNNDCNFCSTPYLNEKKWRGRTADNVFEEIKQWHEKGVKTFIIEDLNPTVNSKRIKDLCQMIIDSGIFIKIKIASGTKIETIDEDTLLWMYDAGFDYLSFSPETGSNRLLDAMNKKFDHKYALKMLDFINSDRFINPMITQACFVLGYPSEKFNDLLDTQDYIKELAKHGLDEIALFNFVPIKGAKIASKYDVPLDKVSFSSLWNKEMIEKLNRRRLIWTIYFYINQIFYHPDKMFRFFDTKVWMTLKRIILCKIYKNKYEKSFAYKSS